MQIGQADAAAYRSILSVLPAWLYIGGARTSNFTPRYYVTRPKHRACRTYKTSNTRQQARGYEQSDKQAAQRSRTHLSGRYIGSSRCGCCVRCIDSSRPPGCRGGERGQISLLGHNLGPRVGCRQLTLLDNHLLHPRAHCKQL